MPIVQHRRGTLVALTAANEIPSAGEIYLETDTNKLKVGNGVTSYTSLPYLVGSGGASGGSSVLNQSLTALPFNGVLSSFALAIGGASVSPANAQSLIIEINGVIQIPDVAYTVSGSTIYFTIAPAATDVFSGVYLSGIAPAAVFSGATITSAATDDYQLPIAATHVLLTSTVSKTFSSFVAEVAGEKWVYNASTVASGAIITLTHAATTGTAANRLATETGAAIIIQPNHSVLLAYDPTISRWRVSRAQVSVNEAWWAAHADKTKLTGIATGATANSTDAQLRDRSTHTGAQATSTITGLDSTVTALTASIATKQVAGTYATLVSGLVPSGQLPSYVDDVLEFATYALLPASGEAGKIYLVLATSRIYRWTGTVYVLIEASPGSSDSVVEGTTNLYFTSARATTAVQASLDLKAPLASPTFTGTVGGVTAAMVGLGSVNNTADTAKAVSTATQTALDLKAALSHTHTASAITDFTTAVTAVAPATTDASLLTSGTLADARLSANAQQALGSFHPFLLAGM